MAKRPPSLRSCGCVVSYGARCHHAAAGELQRPTARQRGYDTPYQAAAAEYLKTHRWCTCGKPAVLVRHVVSIALRPDLSMDQSNWLPGCRSCNARDFQRESKVRANASRVTAVREVLLEEWGRKGEQTRGVVGTLGDRGRDRLGQQRDIFPDFSSSGKGQK